jgi:hypothetical protein
VWNPRRSTTTTTQCVPKKPKNKRDQKGGETQKTVFSCIYLFLFLQATTGVEDIHNLQPKAVHQRVPTYLGSPEDVQELLETLGTLKK